MKYVTEVGVILSTTKNILHLTHGNPASVEFDSEMIWQLHQKQPGIIFGLAHTHPPYMTELSKRDIVTLRTWARALAPFPFCLITVTIIDEPSSLYPDFQTTVYLGQLESKREWELRGEGGVRKFEIKTIEIKKFEMDNQQYRETCSPWEALLILESYQD